MKVAVASAPVCLDAVVHYIVRIEFLQHSVLARC